MAGIDEIFSSDGDAFYDPMMDENTLPDEGTYPAHIVGLEVSKDKVIKGQYLADIYNPKYKLAPEAGSFAGLEVRGRGIFRFKKPSGSNTSLTDRRGAGNRQYKEFLDTLSIPCDEVKDEFSGKPRYKLTAISSDSVWGKPVMVSVKHRSFKRRDGTESMAADGYLEMAWGDGKELEPDMPF